MSRTDKDLPYFVQEIHHAADGGRTEVWHGLYCRERVDPFTGEVGPKRDWRLRRVPRAEAEANGWPEDPRYADLNAMVTYRTIGVDEFGREIRQRVPAAERRITVREPVESHACDLDTATGRCHRYGSSTHRRWYTGTGPSRAIRHAEFYGPERAAVRDACRQAVLDYNGTHRNAPGTGPTGGGDGMDEWEPARDIPVRQARRATWAGGWWD